MLVHRQKNSDAARQITAKQQIKELTIGSFRWTLATSCYFSTWLQVCASYCSSSAQ